MFCTKVWYSKLMCCCCFHKFWFWFIFIIVRKSFLSFFFRLRNSFDNGDFFNVFLAWNSFGNWTHTRARYLQIRRIKKKTKLGGGQCHKLTPSLSFFSFYLPPPPSFSFFFLFSLSLTWVWTTTTMVVINVTTIAIVLGWLARKKG